MSHVNTLASCFKAAVNMDRSGTDEIVQSAKELFALTAPGVALPITLDAEEDRTLRDAFLEIGGTTGKRPNLSRTVVSRAHEKAQEIHATAVKEGVFKVSTYQRRPIQ